jgi:hypothetical protein
MLTVFEQAHQSVLHQVLDFFALTAVTGQNAPHFLQVLRPAGHDGTMTSAVIEGQT